MSRELTGFARHAAVSLCHAQKHKTTEYACPSCIAYVVAGVDGPSEGVREAIGEPWAIYCPSICHVQRTYAERGDADTYCADLNAASVTPDWVTVNLYVMRDETPAALSGARVPEGGTHYVDSRTDAERAAEPKSTLTTSHPPGVAEVLAFHRVGMSYPPAPAWDAAPAPVAGSEPVAFVVRSKEGGDMSVWLDRRDADDDAKAWAFSANGQPHKPFTVTPLYAAPSLRTAEVEAAIATLRREAWRDGNQDRPSSSWSDRAASALLALTQRGEAV